VLHRLDAVEQGEIDSVAVAPDGSFVLRLPSMPTGAPDEMYFASVRHQGVMYFGDAITRPLDLDSLYVIQAWDTLVAPPEGVQVTLVSRSMFFEQSGSQWAVTDVFQIRNDADRTVIPAGGGRVWSYPLPAGVSDVSAMEDMSADAISQEGGDIVFRTALQPGERMFVLRYFVDSLSVTIPTPGEPEVMDVLVREPAPSFAIEGMVQGQGFQLDNGQMYRQFAGENLAQPEIRIALVEEVPPPPVEWIAVVLAMVLLGGGLLALRGSRGRTVAPVGAGPSRQDVLIQIARLDEEYERESSPSKSRTREYQRKRAELMSRLQPNG
jgi:hypothetical protein